MNLVIKFVIVLLNPQRFFLYIRWHVIYGFVWSLLLTACVIIKRLVYSRNPFSCKYFIFFLRLQVYVLFLKVFSKNKNFYLLWKNLKITGYSRQNQKVFNIHKFIEIKIQIIFSATNISLSGVFLHSLSSKIYLIWLFILSLSSLKALIFRKVLASGLPTINPSRSLEKLVLTPYWETSRKQTLKWHWICQWTSSLEDKQIPVRSEVADYPKILEK